MLDFYRGTLSARRLWVLLKHLPRTSAFKRAVDPAGTAWDDGQHMLAVAIDLLQAANWQRANEGVKKSEQSPYPKPFWRPGDTQRAEIEEKQVMDVVAAERAYRAAKGADS